VWGWLNPHGARSIFWKFFYKPLYGGPGLNPEWAAVAAASAYRQGLMLWTASLLVLGVLVLRRRRGWMSLFLPAFIFVDLFANNAGLNATAPAAVYEYESPVVRELKSDRGVFRVYSPILKTQQLLLGEREEGLFEWASDFLVGETSLPYGIFKVHGGGTLRILEMEFLASVAGDPNVRPEVRERLLDVMNVAYEIEPAAPGHEVIYGGASREVRLVKRESALPRAYVVGRVEVVPDPALRASRLVDASFDPRGAVILEAAPGEGWMAEGEKELEWSVENVSYELNSVSMDVSLDGYGMVVVSDTYFPGWVAEVDGNAAEVYRANVAFRAVALEPGEHKVEMRYEPESFRVGLWISCLTVVALVLIASTLGVTACRKRPDN